MNVFRPTLSTEEVFSDMYLMPVQCTITSVYRPYPTCLWSLFNVHPSFPGKSAKICLPSAFRKCFQQCRGSGGSVIKWPPGSSSGFGSLLLRFKEILGKSSIFYPFYFLNRLLQIDSILFSVGSGSVRITDPRHHKMSKNHHNDSFHMPKEYLARDSVL